VSEAHVGFGLELSKLLNRGFKVMLSFFFFRCEDFWIVKCLLKDHTGLQYMSINVNISHILVSVFAV